MKCPRCGERNDDSSIQCLSCGAGLHLPAPPPPPAVERHEPRFVDAAARPVRPSPPPFPPAPLGPGRPESGDRPVNYLVPAIVASLFCCQPLGVVALVFTLQASAKSAAGDRVGAIQASQTARRLLRLSFGVGLALYVVWILAAAVGGLATK